MLSECKIQKFTLIKLALAKLGRKYLICMKTKNLAVKQKDFSTKPNNEKYARIYNSQ